MADATIIIDGGIVADPRWNNPGQNRVGNLTVRAGRSRKNDQGGYDQLSSTPFDVACWNEVHDLLAAQSPEKGSQVRITGTVTGVRTYEDQQGQTQASVEVRADGVRVFPKRQPQGGVGGRGGVGLSRSSRRAGAVLADRLALSHRIGGHRGAAGGEVDDAEGDQHQHRDAQHGRGRGGGERQATGSLPGMVMVLHQGVTAAAVSPCAASPGPSSLGAHGTDRRSRRSRRPGRARDCG